MNWLKYHFGELFYNDSPDKYQLIDVYTNAPIPRRPLAQRQIRSGDGLVSGRRNGTWKLVEITEIRRWKLVT